MKFFIDTAEIAEIEKWAPTGFLDGVTTNPSLIKKSGRDMIEVITQICEITDTPVSAEVAALDYEGMLKEAEVLKKIAPNVCIKLPTTMAGLHACSTLTKQGVNTNLTLCFSANQALLVAKAGATYVSPFIGRLDDINLDGMQLIEDIRTIYDNYGYETQILAASIRSANHMSDCAKIGADVATAPPNVIKAMANHILTDKGLAGFMADVEKAGIKIL